LLQSTRCVVQRAGYAATDVSVDVRRRGVIELGVISVGVPQSPSNAAH